MNCDEHLAKARRILAGMNKLDASSDTLAIIDGTMLAGYHLAGAVLHSNGVTETSVHFNTPSKFEVPAETLPPAVKPAYDAFVKLEDLRSRYVRSANSPDASVAEDAQRILAEMSRHCGL